MADGVGDACSEGADEDGDGVAEDVDLCPGTTFPDDPTRELRPNHLRATADGWVDADGTVVATLEEAGGCSLSQVIALRGLGTGHARFGLSTGEFDAWLAEVAAHSSDGAG